MILKHKLQISKISRISGRVGRLLTTRPMLLMIWWLASTKLAASKKTCRRHW